MMMIRLSFSRASFANAKPFSIHNIFNGQPIQKYTSFDSHALSSLLQTATAHKRIWAELPNQQKETNIQNFLRKLQSQEVVSECSRLLSGSTGKELSECQAELKVGIQIFKHQWNFNVHGNNSFGESGFRLEPFDFITSVFDHRQPFLSSFAYLALALKSNNALLLRPSPQVLPSVEFIVSLWNSISEAALLNCLVDSEIDPKHEDCSLAALLPQTEGFLSFRGRLQDGLDFHYFMSQATNNCRESEFLLTSSDAAYVMKDLSESQLQEAARIVARGCFSNCGHNFNSLKRVFVDRELSSRFQDLLLQEAKQYQIHQSIAEKSAQLEFNQGKLAPFLLQSQFQESSELLLTLKEKHQQEIKWVQGGETLKQKVGERELSFITPAVFRVETDFPSFNYQNLQCMMPICFLVPVDSPNACLQKINSSIFGTTASLFTNQLELAESLGEKLEVGTVNLNNWEVASGVTYSGRKRSGQGFSLSGLSFNNLVKSKSFSFS